SGSLQEPCYLAAYEPFSSTVLGRVVRPTGACQEMTPLDFRPRFSPREVIGWEPIDDYPVWDEYEELGVQQEGARGSGISHDEFVRMYPCYGGDKLGGWPEWWCQSPSYPACIRCGRRMRLLFQVGACDNLTLVIGRASPGLLTQCPEHREIVTFQT